MANGKHKTLTPRFLIVMAMLCIVGFICINIPFFKIVDFSNNSNITFSELQSLQAGNIFGPFISVSVKDESKVANVNMFTCDKKISYEPEVQLKLFNLIPIKTQKVKIIQDDRVLVGGCAVGLVLKTEGVMVVGSSPVTTLDGEVDVLEQNTLKIGDIITQIENETVDNVSSVSKIINKPANINRELFVKIKRNKKDCEIKLKPCYDVKSQNYKLGVWVRDDASGIGTLTYINSNNRFGALGHPICDSDTKSVISLKEGEVYNCTVLGANKGVSGSPGELKGLFMQGKNCQGVVEKNSEYGVFGTIYNDSNFLKDYQEMEVGSRLSVKPGKAQIRCCLDGNKIETFDVEIIKTNYQNYSNGKSLVLRVTDKDLIARTGGIVQGMSGSPIIQDGKLIGAVTHVFVNDPTKGFGVYIDWMLNE